MKKTFVIDIDNTICVAFKVGDAYDYINAKPIQNVIDEINKNYLLGNRIILFTSRGMRTFDRNIDKIEEFHRPILEKWLKKNKVGYDELIFGKPWGPNVHYIDDKNLSIDEFVGEKYD